MEKRTVLAVVLMIAVIFLTNLLFPPVRPPSGEEVSGTDTVARDTERVRDRAREQGPGVTSPARPGISPGREGAAPEQLEQEVPQGLFPGSPAQAGETVVVAGPVDTLRFSTQGAVLTGVTLNRYRSYANSDPRDVPVQLVRAGDRLLGYRIVVGSDTLDLRNRIFTASASKLDLSGMGPRLLTFSYALPGTALTFEVTYRFDPEGYEIQVEGGLRGFRSGGYSVLTSLGHGLRSNEADSLGDFHDLARVVGGRTTGIHSKRFDKVHAGEREVAEGAPFKWVAIKSKYFLGALIAPPESPGFGGAVMYGGTERHSAEVIASLPVPEGSDGFAFDTYMGPQEFGRLKAIGQDFENVNPYGYRFLRPVLRPLVGLIMLVLTWMHTTLSLPYGWVLILFGVLMRVVLFPLYQKSMRSQMAQMQVQPLMKELQTKYKDDPQKMQKEVMKLYKEHNVNPLGGCLPMMLPMPVLFALFFVFKGTIEFRGVPFLWLPDLSLKDPLYIIPIVMGLSMFVLTWIGQRGMEPNAQMKMMGYAMPAVFTIMFVNFPSGLNLYYTTSNLASLPQQLYLSRERQQMRARTEIKREESGADAGSSGGSGRRKSSARRKGA